MKEMLLCSAQSHKIKTTKKTYLGQICKNIALKIFPVCGISEGKMADLGIYLRVLFAIRQLIT
jgi:hypothetical protein